MSKCSLVVSVLKSRRKLPRRCPTHHSTGPARKAAQAGEFKLSGIDMATWKKVLLGLLTVAIVTIGGCIALLDHFFSDMCATTVIDQVASPSGKLKAVVFQIDCGVGSDFNSQVAIVPGNMGVSQKDALPKSFFAADSDHGRAPECKEHGPEIRLTWLSESRLEIQHHEHARVIRAEESSKGVTIGYRTFR